MARKGYNTPEQVIRELWKAEVLIADGMTT